jgi:hypothetical protein
MIFITKWLRLAVAVGLPWAEFIMPFAGGQQEDAMRQGCRRRRNLLESGRGHGGYA